MGVAMAGGTQAVMCGCLPGQVVKHMVARIGMFRRPAADMSMSIREASVGHERAIHAS